MPQRFSPYSILDCDATLTSFSSFTIYIHTYVFFQGQLIELTTWASIYLIVIQEHYCHGAMDTSAAPWLVPNETAV